jgi:broad-specificity NMP kinase
MYYVVYKHDNVIRTTIHLGTHDHPVVESHLREMFEQVKSLVKEEASHTLGATMLAIALATSKTFLLEHLAEQGWTRANGSP